jgi:hypothetical protein
MKKTVKSNSSKFASFKAMDSSKSMSIFGGKGSWTSYTAKGGDVTDDDQGSPWGKWTLKDAADTPV